MSTCKKSWEISSLVREMKSAMVVKWGWVLAESATKLFADLQAELNALLPELREFLASKPPETEA